MKPPAKRYLSPLKASDAPPPPSRELRLASRAILTMLEDMERQSSIRLPFPGYRPAVDRLKKAVG